MYCFKAILTACTSDSPHTAENIKHVSEYGFSRAEREALLFDKAEIWLMIYLVRRLRKLQIFTARKSETGASSCSYGMILVCSRRLLRELNRETRIRISGNADCRISSEQAQNFFLAIASILTTDTPVSQNDSSEVRDEGLKNLKSLPRR